jgi:hypothetical protein
MPCFKSATEWSKTVGSTDFGAAVLAEEVLDIILSPLR